MISSRRHIKSFFSLLLLISFLVWVSYYISSHFNEFKLAYDVPLMNLGSMYLIFLTALFLSGIYTKHLLAAYGVHIDIKECTFLSIASSAANFITFFRGGAGIRALYLKSKYSFSFADFISSLSAYYIMQLMVNGMLGLIGLVLLVHHGLSFDLPFAIFFFTSFLGSAFLLLSGIKLKQHDRFPMREIAKIINGWLLLRNQMRLFKMLMFNSVLYSLLIILQTKIAFATYGVDLQWGAIFFYSAGQIPVSLLTLTPGAIGIQETFTVYMGKALKYTTAEAIQVQILLRFISISTLAVAGPWAISRLGSRLHK